MEPDQLGPLRFLGIMTALAVVFALVGGAGGYVEDLLITIVISKGSGSMPNGACARPRRRERRVGWS